MKRFNISKNSTVICGRKLPQGAVYGQFELPIYYAVRKFTDKGVMYLEQHRETEKIVYYLDDFRSVEGHYFIHVYRNNHWNNCISTGQDKKYIALEEFIRETIKKAQGKGNLSTSPISVSKSDLKPINPIRKQKHRNGCADRGKYQITDYSCSKNPEFADWVHYAY